MSDMSIQVKPKTADPSGPRRGKRPTRISRIMLAAGACFGLAGVGGLVAYGTHSTPSGTVASSPLAVPTLSDAQGCAAYVVENAGELLNQTITTNDVYFALGSHDPMSSLIFSAYSQLAFGSQQYGAQEGLSRVNALATLACKRIYFLDAYRNDVGSGKISPTSPP